MWFYHITFPKMWYAYQSIFFLISFFLSYFVAKYLIFCEWIHLIMMEEVFLLLWNLLTWYCVECCAPQKRYIGALTFLISECDLLWNKDFYEGNQNKVRSLDWAKFNIAGVPIKMEHLDSNTHTGKMPFEDEGTPNIATRHRRES